MFLDIDKWDADTEAIVDGDGLRVTYGQLRAFTERFCTQVGGRCLVAIITENCAGACAGYAAAMSGRIVPLMLSHTLADEVLQSLFDTYHPSFLWVPQKEAEAFSGEACFSELGYVLLKTGYEPYPMAEELSLLLPTSGSTGSPKLVRHS